MMKFDFFMSATLVCESNDLSVHKERTCREAWAVAAVPETRVAEGRRSAQMGCGTSGATGDRETYYSKRGAQPGHKVWSSGA
jgi:hypothetical protein